MEGPRPADGQNLGTERRPRSATTSSTPWSTTTPGWPTPRFSPTSTAPPARRSSREPWPTSHAHGITQIDTLMTDNAWAYKWSLRQICADLGIHQIFIKVHCPWQNGKVERLNRTLQTEWAYRQASPATTTAQPPLRPGSSTTTLNAATAHSEASHRSAGCYQPDGPVHLAAAAAVPATAPVVTAAPVEPAAAVVPTPAVVAAVEAAAVERAGRRHHHPREWVAGTPTSSPRSRRSIPRLTAGTRRPRPSTGPCAIPSGPCGSRAPRGRRCGRHPARTRGRCGCRGRALGPRHVDHGLPACCGLKNTARGPPAATPRPLGPGRTPARPGRPTGCR